MNVLSIDWDFFFPDAAWYDWGHKEDPLFLEMLWFTRVSARNIHTGEFAMDAYVPDMKLLKGFWQKTICKDPVQLVITDSHKDMFHVLNLLGGADEVYNFDAHHDYGYDQCGCCENIDGCDSDVCMAACDNWAKLIVEEGLCEEYHVCYPEWRRDTPETDGEEVPYTVSYGIPDSLPEFDIVFVCRSSAWTPPWFDDQFKAFVSYWEANEWLWDSRLTVPFVELKRKLAMDEARKLQKQMLEQLEGWSKNEISENSLA